MRKPVFIFILFLLSTLPIHAIHATPLEDKPGYEPQIRNLDLLLKSIDDTSEKIAALQEALQGSRGVGREREPRSQINELSLRLRDMERTFDQLSTGVDVRVFEAEEKKGLDWNLELTELLGPVIRELKKITSRPREIEKLRNRIKLYRSQLPATQKALNNLDALLGVLYLFGDWALLPIAIIFILGIAWASKQAIPRFWSQAKLILNFGPVKEGERVIYNGLPYEVTSINLFTELVNPDLEGGHIRLPLKDLLELRSRPISEKEPWFPSRCGDWVILNDATHGKVVVQTPEIVELELLGGASMTYRTVDYLSRSPTNLSCGFRLWITFGLDYAHQRIITEEIPATLEKAIIDELTAEGHGDSINTISVQFKEAGPSSLDVSIMAAGVMQAPNTTSLTEPYKGFALKPAIVTTG